MGGGKTEDNRQARDNIPVLHARQGRGLGIGSTSINFCLAKRPDAARIGANFGDKMVGGAPVRPHPLS